MALDLSCPNSKALSACKRYQRSGRRIDEKIAYGIDSTFFASTKVESDIRTKAKSSLHEELYMLANVSSNFDPKEDLHVLID